jgi:hypothetical protein
MKRIGDLLEDGPGKLKKVKLEDYEQFLQVRLVLLFVW